MAVDDPVPTPDPTAPPTRRARRRPRLSVRALLVVVALVALPLAWKARRASVQRRAVAAVERIGGTVLYDWELDAPHGDFLAIHLLRREDAEPPTPRWLRRWLGDEYFQEVVGVKVSGLSSAPLPGMPPPPPGGRREWANLSDQQIAIKRREEFVTADQLACLDGLDRVRWFELGSMDLVDAGRERIARMPTVEALDLDLKADGPLLSALARLPRLRELNVGLSVVDLRPSDAPILARLRTLKLGGRPSDPALDWLNRHVDLADLTFLVDGVDDSALARLTGLAHLARLELRYAAPMTGAGPALVTDAGLARVAEMRGLREVEVRNVKGGITDAGLAHLARLPRLESLSLHAGGGIEMTEITDASLAHLGRCRSLRRLHLSTSPSISDAGLAHLAGLRDLEELSLDSAEVTDAGLAHLAAHSRLRTLLIRSASTMTDAGPAPPAGLRRIEDPRPGAAEGITDAGLAHLDRLGELESIDLQAPNGITDAGLAALAKRAALRRVRLGPSRITAAGLSAFRAARPDVSANVQVEAAPPPPEGTPDAPR